MAEHAQGVIIAELRSKCHPEFISDEKTKIKGKFGKDLGKSDKTFRTIIFVKKLQNH